MKKEAEREARIAAAKAAKAAKAAQEAESAKDYKDAGTIQQLCKDASDLPEDQLFPKTV